VIEWFLQANSTAVTTALKQSSGLSLTDWIAAYGALLSTILAVLGGVRWFLEKRPRIQVTSKLGFMTAPGQSGTSDYLIYFEAANIGERPVTLSIPYLRLPDGRNLWMPKVQRLVPFPHDLLPGKKCMVWEELRGLARGLSEEGFSGEIMVVCMFDDAVGNSYKSKPIRIGIDHWLAASPLSRKGGDRTAKSLG
jgi:hypothetical protein